MWGASARGQAPLLTGRPGALQHMRGSYHARLGARAGRGRTCHALSLAATLPTTAACNRCLQPRPPGSVQAGGRGGGAAGGAAPAAVQRAPGGLHLLLPQLARPHRGAARAPLLSCRQAVAALGCSLGGAGGGGREGGWRWCSGSAECASEAVFRWEQGQGGSPHREQAWQCTAKCHNA